MEFVTFEIAKKLKEKGYPQVKKNTLSMYDEVGDWCSLAKNLDDFEYLFEDFDDKDCVCPTISQALKWLREEKKVHIGFGYSPRKKWLYVVVYMDGRYYNQPTLTVDGFAKIEKAALAGIEYCLDNLI